VAVGGCGEHDCAFADGVRGEGADAVCDDGVGPQALEGFEGRG